ncbi:MAG: hypothetical protein U7123_15855 [Potamolinea sp.]
MDKTRAAVELGNSLAIRPVRSPSMRLVQPCITSQLLTVPAFGRYRYYGLTSVKLMSDTYRAGWS